MWNRPKSANGRRGKRRGTAVLETAVSLSVLLYLTFGMVEFGYYFYIKNAFASASRLGARAAIVPFSTNASVTSAVQTALAPFNIPSANYTVAISSGGSALTLGNTTPAGTNVQVTVSATWSVIGNGFSPMHLIGGSKVVSNSCVMEHQ